VISSATAAGYEDFIDQLSENPPGFKFYFKLFPAIMQGQEAEQSIIAALDKVYEFELFFDCVVIIRGGGSQADLNCFNSYSLAYHITQFPLPVLTGIGHEQDDSVTDMVAHTRLKTPTAVAAFLIDAMSELANELEQTGEMILGSIRELLLQAQNSMVLLSKNLQIAVNENVVSAENILNHLKHSLSSQIRRKIHHTELQMERCKALLKFAAELVLSSLKYNLRVDSSLLKHSSSRVLSDSQNQLGSIHRQISALDPQGVLARGYSITFKDGTTIKDADLLNTGDLIETMLFRGKIETTVKRKIV
jgi:exodeoxyribonuclease VII large subunit